MCHIIGCSQKPAARHDRYGGLCSRRIERAQNICDFGSYRREFPIFCVQAVWSMLHHRRSMTKLTIANKILDMLFRGVERPEDLPGDAGRMKAPQGHLMKRMLGTERTEHLGYAPNATARAFPVFVATRVSPVSRERRRRGRVFAIQHKLETL